MNITIEKNSIYQGVISLTARIGITGGAYQNIAATEDNEAMLNLYLTAAISEMEGELLNRLKHSHTLQLRDENETITIEIEDKVRMDYVVEGVIHTNLKLAIVHYITAAWLEPTPAKEMCESYRDSSAGYLAKVIEALNRRKPFVLGRKDYKGRHGDDTKINRKTEKR